MLKLMCEECRFKFSVINKPNICPYCSAENSLINNNKGEAQRILDEVEQDDFKYGE